MTDRSLSDLSKRTNRRAFLEGQGARLGSIALASLLANRSSRGAEIPHATGVSAGPYQSRGIVNPFHVPPRAKRVIFLYMSGGPSHLETFDYKPELAKQNGRPMPDFFTMGMPIAQLQGQELRCLGPVFEFKKHGQSGQEISSVLPRIAHISDEICIIRSMVTESISHDPAHMYMNTGSLIPGRPSMGSWVLYGLGSESENLPGFVVLSSLGGRSPQPISARQWNHGFLDSKFQGVEFRSKGAPVSYLENPPGIDHHRQKDVIDAVGQLNVDAQSVVSDPEMETRLQNYELAFRMQMSIPELLDFSDEPQGVLDRYGAQAADGSFAANCILARRMAERGVRFIQLYHRGWDHHNDLKMFMGICAGHCDQASAALVTDLRERGMLDDTLVIWGGEFGRTPMSQAGKGDELGRDHHIKGFSMWLAGGGIKPGITHGETDDLGYHAAKDVVHVNDLHATILHLLGIDHTRLTVRTQGRDFRLTDVRGEVVSKILA